MLYIKGEIINKTVMFVPEGDSEVGCFSEGLLYLKCVLLGWLGESDSDVWAPMHPFLGGC